MSLAGKNFLILGGSGFIGTNTTLRLQGLGANVLNVDIRKPQVRVETIIEDLAKSDFSFLTARKWDYILIFAAKINPRQCDEDPGATFDVNVRMLYLILRKIVDLRLTPKKIFFNSSTVIYDDSLAALPSPENSPRNYQTDLYCLTKGLDEEICGLFLKKHALPLFCFRPSHVYGPYQMWREQDKPNLIAQVVTQAILKKEIVLWNRKTSRDFLYIDDLVDAYIAAFESDFTGFMNFGSQVATPIADVASIVSEFTGAKVSDLNKEAQKPFIIQLDASLAKQKLGWSAKVGIKEGLKRTIEFYKNAVKT